MDKKQKAKKNYERFLERLGEIQDKEKEEKKVLYTSYLVRNNGEVVEDYYWTDHEITPTRVYKWLKDYNIHTTPRDEWVKEARIPEGLYDELLTKLGHSGSVEMEEVLVVPKRT